MLVWLAGAAPRPELLAQIGLACLLWARLVALFSIAPWIALGARPRLLGLGLSAAATGALWPIALAGAGPAPEVPLGGLQLLAACLPELLRGLVLALGCSLPFAAVRATGGLGDSVRGAQLGVMPEPEAAAVLARLYGLAGLVAALGLSAHLGAARLILDGLTLAPLGRGLDPAADLASALRGLAGWIFQAFELGVTLGAPLLLSAWLGAILFGLLLRVAGRIVAPWPSTLLPWFGLAVVCLSLAGTLDEIPAVVRLFARETRRALETLH